MPISGSDILYVLSGGSANTNPNLSLGGDPSVQTVLNSTNNLFADVTTEQANQGFVDYRCFYIFNDSFSETLFEAKLFIFSEVDDGSSVQIGITQANDVQSIVVLGTVSGGSFTVSFDSTPVVVAYNSNVSVWASNLQVALRTISGLGDVTVSVSAFFNSVNFTVNFVGTAGNKFQPLLVITNNSLTGSGISLSVSKVVDGGPINLIAPQIDVSTTTPFGVMFSIATELNPILIGDFGPTDGIAVWMQRTTPNNSLPLANDGFKIRFSGFSII